MKRYFLGLVPKVTLAICLVWLGCFIIAKVTSPPKKPKKYPVHWTNLDPSRGPHEVKKYNYKTRTVEYYERGVYKNNSKIKYEPSTSISDLILLDTNMDVELLYDFYKD